MKLKFLLSLHLLNVFAFAFWGPLFTAYAVSLGASPSLAGSLYAFYTLFHAGTIFLFGQLDKRTNRFVMVTGGYILQGLCAFIFMATVEPFWLWIPLALSAVGGGMIAPAWKGLYTRSMKVGSEGEGWSFYDSGGAFVIAGGAFFAGIMANQYGYNAIFIPLLVVNLLAALLSLRYRHLMTPD